MLCSSSISTGKSNNSKWLDRLRSSKGFPSGTDLDLDQFLSLQNPNLSNSSSHTKLDNIDPQLQTNSAHSREILDLDQFLPRQNPNLSHSSSTKLAGSTSNNIDPQMQTNSPRSDILDQKQSTEIPRENGEKEWFGIMSNVLAELFYMGDSKDISRIKRKKSFRKQLNPKICVISKSLNDETALAVPSSLVEMEGKSERRDLTEQDGVNVAPLEGEEEDKCRADLSGFSRTEVTVIDTSCPSWKFDKMLYRRKNVWKVRDKKGKTVNFGRKKRKLSPLEENVGLEKKAKLSIGQCSSSKDTNGEEGKMPLNEGHDLSDKMDEACKDAHKKRFPRKLKKGGSSVVLIKSIPTSKKKAAI